MLILRVYTKHQNKLHPLCNKALITLVQVSVVRKSPQDVKGTKDTISYKTSILSEHLIFRDKKMRSLTINVISASSSSAIQV